MRDFFSNILASCLTWMCLRIWINLLVAYHRNMMPLANAGVVRS
jgi:hypothetical protein